MKFSESLRTGTVKASAGGILSRFGVRVPRRNVAFFSDIVAAYVKECEDSGYGNGMMECTKEWSMLYANHFLPSVFKRIPHTVFINTVLRPVWINMGLLDGIVAGKDGELVFIETVNEGTTRLIGKNHFTAGLYAGTLTALYGSNAELEFSEQNMEKSLYKFRISGSPPTICSKDKQSYIRLNSAPESPGPSLEDALRNRMFSMGGNRIFFRGRELTVAENTLSHIIGNKGILMERVPGISQRFFKPLLRKESLPEERLVLLKNLLQVMGWGNVRILHERERIVLEITNPPYGLQLERDNWDFIANTILGYLWSFDPGLAIKEKRVSGRKLIISFS